MEPLKLSFCFYIAVQKIEPQIKILLNSKLFLKFLQITIQFVLLTLKLTYSINQGDQGGLTPPPPRPECKKRYLEWDFVKAELDMQRIKWLEESELDRPTCAIEALGECTQALFPNIHKLLKILATLPVSTCTPKRTFSSLKPLKTYLRNYTGQERLNGLALMSIHRRIDIDIEEVINLSAAKKARRLNLIL